MKKSQRIFSMLLFAGIALGGLSMYLVYVLVSTNETTETASSNEIPNSRGGSSGEGFQLNHSSLLHLHSSYLSAASLEDPSLHENSFQLRLAVYSFVAGLSTQELMTELQTISSYVHELSHHVRDELQRALIERLAIVNPHAATEYVVEQFEPISNQSEFVRLQRYLNVEKDTSLPMVQTVFKDWATSDLQSAIDSAKKLAIDFKNNALIGILAALRGESFNTYRQVAKELGDEEQGTDAYILSFATTRVNDPRAAWHEVIALYKPNNSSHTQALRNITRQWYEQIGFGVVDKVESSNLDKNVRTDLIVQLLTHAVADKPDQAFQYSLTMSSENRDTSATSRVVNTWAALNAEAAYQAVSGIEKSGDREYFQQRVVRLWALNEPRQVLVKSENFPPIVRRSAIDDAITTIAMTAPKEAAELAVIHGSSGPNDFLPSYVIGIWMEIDLEAALNWVYSAPLDEEKRYTWVSAITSNLVESDPRRAFDLAVKQEIPDINLLGMEMYETGLEAEVIRRIAYQNLDLAVELLPQVREGITKTRAYISVGDRYIDDGHSTEALELGLKLPNDDQASYFQSIAFSWARIDPAGFVESLERLPTEEIRSRIAATMSSQWAREQFTEEQIDTLKQYLSDSDRQTLEDQ